MAAQTVTTQIFVWCPVGETHEDFQHPSDIPVDEKTAKVRWVENVRGPHLARISPASLLQTKGQLAMIAENGATREVPKSMVLPWYEGLLLLDELENTSDQSGHLHATWRNEELNRVLDQERNKFKHLSGALYAEKRLVNTAVTGASFVDKEDREWAYRRENIKSEDRSGLVDGQDSGSFFRIKEVLQYLPPWEAFCHDKCGFYQDFYLIRWEYPFSVVDYSKVENGCPTNVGATWEPDECLPAHLDPLRLAAKKAWIKKQRDTEEKKKLAAKRTQGSSPPETVKKSRTDAGPEQSVAKKEEKEEVKEEEVKEEDEAAKPPMVKKQKFRTDGKPLEQDSFRHEHGHDFTPQAPENLAGIRSGWPKTPQEYPKGYGVANPPGFCWEGCDCMDDQRPQRAWETHKAWIEEKERTGNALACIENFSKRADFVRRRGQVSKMCFFETAQEKRPDLTHSTAALDLAGSVSRRIAEVLKAIPLQSLTGGGGPRVAVPAAAFLAEDMDVEPLNFKGTLTNGEPLPPWLHVGSSTGELTATETTLSEDIHLQIELFHSEGLVGRVPLTITPSRPLGSMQPWMVASGAIVARFNNSDSCPLDKNARAVLNERLDEIYDFKFSSVREVPLGQWLKSIAVLLRMLRSSAVALITPSALGNQRGVRKG